jgi:hypothetical protein
VFDLQNGVSVPRLWIILNGSTVAIRESDYKGVHRPRGFSRLASPSTRVECPVLMWMWMSSFSLWLFRGWPPVWALNHDTQNMIGTPNVGAAPS